MSDHTIQLTLTSQTITFVFRFLSIYSFALLLTAAIIILVLGSVIDGIYLILLSLLLVYSDWVSNTFIKRKIQFLHTLGGRGIVYLILGLKLLQRRSGYDYNHRGPDPALGILVIINAVFYLLTRLVIPTFELPAPIRFNIRMATSPIQLQDEKTSLIHNEEQAISENLDDN